jgi:hypothetical protein|tara:strand:- start:18522 stop:18860 length:339 start_codon:yes stop_codon:yes gene_type:complete
MSLFLIVYLFFKKRDKNIVKIPSNTLFFYSMENCPHCLLMEYQFMFLEKELSNMEIFKITLKKDGSVEYSNDSEELKQVSLKNKIDAYPTFMFSNKVHLGSMERDELLNFIK